jgi:primary-amine oxidase
MTTIAWSGAIALIFPVVVAAQATRPPGRHPLDPLTAPEIETVTRVLRDAGKSGEHVRFGVIALHEPRKVDGARAPRRADVLTYDWGTGNPSEGVVDLTTKRIVEWRDFPAGDPPLRGLTIA